MRARGLDEAARLYRARKFREVLRLLEPQIFRYRTDPAYYALLGLSCLHTGEIGGAATYLGRASQLDDQNVDVLVGLAAVHLRQREPESAVACWLRVLDIDPEHRAARRGLELLRASGGEVPERLLEEDEFRAFLPLARRGAPRALLFILLALPLLAGGLYAVLRLLPPPRLRDARPGVQDVILPTDRPQLLASAAGSAITMTERELLRSFERAKRYLLEYRDNLAVHEINRILLSNAAVAVKERAELLKSYAAEPDFSTIRDPFGYADVRANPVEYADCHVRWSGRTANVRIGEQLISFDLLVGYQDGRVLQGVVPVRVPFAVAVEDGLGYEVLGRVRADGENVSLDAVSIRPLEAARGGP